MKSLTKLKAKSNVFFSIFWQFSNLFSFSLYLTVRLICICFFYSNQRHLNYIVYFRFCIFTTSYSFTSFLATFTLHFSRFTRRSVDAALIRKYSPLWPSKIKKYGRNYKKIRWLYHKNSREVILIKICG